MLRIQFSTLGLILAVTTATADVKVAFIADQDTHEASQLVLQLVKNEGTDLLLIQGDLAYETNVVDQWADNLNQYLGENFPVLALVGNHEDEEWPEYQSHLTNRINRIADLTCDGINGVKALCNFRGLTIVQVAPAIFGVPGVPDNENYEEFIQQKLSQSNSNWKICSWHKNQNRMQLGVKSDSVGWGVYQACLNQGALVATGHDHSYSRTHLMNDFQNQSVVHTGDHLQIDRGQSFAFVSGLGGRGIREQVIDGDWWAVRYTSTQGASHGALFCTFADVTASCYFKDIHGGMPDRFTMESKLATAPPPVADNSVSQESPTEQNDPLPESQPANSIPEDQPVDNSVPTIQLDSPLPSAEVGPDIHNSNMTVGSIGFHGIFFLTLVFYAKSRLRNRYSWLDNFSPGICKPSSNDLGIINHVPSRGKQLSW